jgi:antagonist of KipI
MGGDRLPLSSRVDDSVGLAGNVVSSEARPPYHHDLELRVVLGPHQDRFEESCIEKMADGVYRLSHQSDRMGYRLNGRKLKHKNGADILSQGMVMGEIQVPADGLPIVMMPDHPTTGGYTCIGTIARADLPLLAQAQPEESEISFKPVSILEAQQALKEVAAKLDAAIQTEEEPWLDY